MSEWIDTLLLSSPPARARSRVWTQTAGAGLACLCPCGAEGRDWTAAFLGEQAASVAKAISHDEAVIRLYNFYSTRVVQVWVGGRVQVTWMSNHSSEVVHELEHELGGGPSTIGDEPAHPRWAELLGVQPATGSAQALLASLGVDPRASVWLEPLMALDSCLRWSTLSVTDDVVAVDGAPALYWYDRQQTELARDEPGAIVAALTNTGGVCHHLEVRAYDDDREVPIAGLTVQGSAAAITVNGSQLHIPLAAGLAVPPPSVATPAERDESLRAWDSRRLDIRVRPRRPITHLHWRSFSPDTAARASWSQPTAVAPDDVFTTDGGR